MIGRLFCLLLLLLSSAAMATTHTITSLPYTFDATQMTVGQTDTLVIAGTKLSSATDGIRIVSTTSQALHDVVLLLGTDTLVFGTNGGDNYSGIAITGPIARRPYDIKVVGGHVIHQPSGSTADRNECISIAGRGITIENVSAIIRGDNGHAIAGGGQSVYGIKILGGTYRSDVMGFYSRCYYDGSVIQLDRFMTSPNVSALPGDTLHALVDGVTITDGPHMGLLLYGYEWNDGNLAYVEVRNCNIQTDARNDFYTSYSGLCFSAANPYGIMFKNVGPGSSAHHNTITSGSDYGGNRGMLIERGRGTQQQPVLVYANTFDVHEGPNSEYADAPVHVLRIRYGPQYINVYDNTFIGTADNNSATTAYGSSIELLRISAENSDANIRISNNRMEARTNSASGTSISAVGLDAVDYPGMITLENNYIVSAGSIYNMGGFNGQGMGGTFIGDTVSFAALNTPNTRTFDIGYLGMSYDCSKHVARDIVYTGGTSDNDIHFANAGTLDIRLERTLPVRVVGNNGLTVSGAQVTVTNNYNRVVLSGSTANGLLTGPVAYRYVSDNIPDSTNYSPFTIKVKVGSDSTIISHVVDATSSLPIITLQNTAGTGNQVDTIPPAAINDLEASIGDQNGQVILGWTAPGDDGGSGAAAGYIVKYDTDPITSGNWSAASGAPFQGFPQSAGATETMTVSGLVPGEQYFFAVRAYDEEQNLASLSNTPETYSHGIKTPQPTATSPDEDNFRVTVSAATVASYVTVTYQFALDSIVTFPNPRVTTALASGGDPSATFDNLASGVTYFWRCRAVEAGGSMTSAWSSPVSFDLANGSVNMITEADMLSPANGGVASGLQPTLEIAEVSGVQFVHFQVENDASFGTPLSSGPIAAASGSSTTWQVPYPLTPGQTYYWRASSDNLNWTAAHTFLTPADSASPVSAAEIFAFPNPMNAAEGHREVTFANLGPESHLTIMSVSGSFVMKDVEVGPGEWVWDCRNENGNTVGSGVYLYYVNAPSKSAKGKIVVIR